MNKRIDNHQLVISPELLYLLDWLITYEQESLKKLVSKALHEGLHKTLTSDSQSHQSLKIHTQLQENITDFFGLLEALLIEASHEEEMDLAHQNTLFPVIKQLDTQSIDSSTLHTMIAKATQSVKLGRAGNPKEALCKELIKRWKPLKNPDLN